MNVLELQIWLKQLQIVQMVETFFAVHRKFNAVHNMFHAIGRFLLLQLHDAGVFLCCKI